MCNNSHATSVRSHTIQVTPAEFPPDSKTSPAYRCVTLGSRMESTIRIKQEYRIFSHNRKRMNLSIGTFVLACSTFSAPATAKRIWSDIQTYHTWNVYDGRFGSEAFESDPLHFTPNPSSPPSRSKSPSLLPTVTISDIPTQNPTKTAMPSVSPSEKPSKRSQRPSSLPSSMPSREPTAVAFPENEPPMNPNSSYFDYNTGLDANYGPGYPELVRHNETYVKIEYFNNGWTTRTPPKNWYWSEFDVNGTGPWKGILANRNPTKNQCDGSPDQSPIDIRDNGAECFEHHQIRKLVRGSIMSAFGRPRCGIMSQFPVIHTRMFAYNIERGLLAG